MPRPPGVVRAIPEMVTCAGQVTTLAATAAGREFFRVEMDASWREACKGFEQQASQVDAARRLTTSPETFAQEAYLHGLAERVSLHVGAQVKKLAAPRVGGDGAGSIDDHVSVVTGDGVRRATRKELARKLC